MWIFLWSPCVAQSVMLMGKLVTINVIAQAAVGERRYSFCLLGRVRWRKLFKGMREFSCGVGPGGLLAWC